jgi:CspA family cold shock protein
MSESTQDQITDTQGQVKWFDPKKGYGFIVGPEGQDIFVHYTVIEGEGFRVLRDGAAVVYDATRSDKGWRATKVRGVASDDDDTEDKPSVVTLPRRSHSRTSRR